MTEATCQHCGGRIVWLNPAWQHDHLSWPWSDPRVEKHPAWPYLTQAQRWAPTRRQSERPRESPWQEASFRAWHPDTTAAERCLSWLKLEFGSR